MWVGLYHQLMAKQERTDSLRKGESYRQAAPGLQLAKANSFNSITLSLHMCVHAHTLLFFGEL